MNKKCKGNNSYEESIKQKKEELEKLKRVLKESREQCKKMERLLNSKS